MQFRILGPLEVTADDGYPVTLGGPKPRALVATLLLNARSVVSTDRLIDAVWGVAPPPNANVALRAYVSRLRSVLPPSDGEARLRYRAPGYQLDVGGDELDATIFTRLVADARAEAAAGDHDRSLRLLDSALGLWRGDVLADLDTRALDAEASIARLDDLRVVAKEERAEAMLRVGQVAEAISELELLMQRVPNRERLAVWLMRALYADGRQADALEVYQRLRRRLVAELGVEPSERTRTVHQQLLAHDPELLVSTARRLTNLPRRGTNYTGRAEEINQLRAIVSRGPLITLTGVGGVGKSRLALEVAAGLQPRFADGVWLCELAPLADGSPVGHAVGAALGVHQRHGLTIEQTVIEYLRGRQLLVLLDNCEHVLNASAQLAHEIVAACRGVVMLATSREALGVEGEQVYPLRPLSVVDATALFVHRARAVQPDFHPDLATEQVVADICRRLDGLPLAIELAAARTRIMSATEMAQRLDEERLRVRGSRTAQPRHQSLAAAIDWSYRLLSTAEQRLFDRLSIFAGSADLAAVHSVCADPGATESDTLDSLASLVDRSMVERVSGYQRSRYRVLETLRAFGRERLSERNELARRYAGYFIRLAEDAARGVQGPDEHSWVERTIPDLDNFRAAFEWVMTQREPDLALRLVTSLPELTQIRLGYEPADWAERALAMASPDHPLFAAGVGAAARGAWNVGDFARARRLATLATDRHPGRGTARTAYPADVTADVDLYEGRVESTLRHYTSEAALARRDDDPLRLVWTLYYVAICHAVRRTPEHGVAAAEESLAIADSTANPTAQSMARYAAGLVLKKSDPGQALRLFDEAAHLAAFVRNFWWQGIALMEAAATRAVHADPVTAAAALAAVLDHWERVGDRTQQWLNLRYITRLLVRLAQDQNAVVLHHALHAAGKPSPLDAPQLAELRDRLGEEHYTGAAARGARLSGSSAVAFARSSLADSV